MIFNWDAITQHKSLSALQAVFVGTTKQVTVNLESTTKKDHLLIGLEEEKVVRSIAKKILNVDTQFCIVDLILYYVKNKIKTSKGREKT